MWVNIRGMLIAPAKILGARRASHHPAFMDNCRTISHTFYSPIYKVHEGNEGVGCEPSSFLQLKTRARGESLM